MALLRPVAGPAPTASSASVRNIAIGDSSFLEHISYDSASLQLTVTFKTGSQHTHFYVLPATVDQWLVAPSKGSFYARNIKGKYPSAKIIDKQSPRYHEPAKGPVNHEPKSVPRL